MPVAARRHERVRDGSVAGCARPKGADRKIECLQHRSGIRAWVMEYTDVPLAHIPARTIIPANTGCPQQNGHERADGGGQHDCPDDSLTELSRAQYVCLWLGNKIRPQFA